MRLWHESMIPYLDRQRLLGQHRECCALRGAGWGRKHATVNYVFEAPPEKLVAYHKLVMREMRERGYNPDPLWETSSYRGQKLGFQEGWINDRKVEQYLDETLTEKIHTIYDEHNLPYLVECVNNLKRKALITPMKNRKIYKPKMTKEELQSYLQIMKQHHIKPSKKGKGSYSRKQKHKGDDF